MVQRRGYTSREFDLDDFRSKVEKRMFDREYSADDIWANYTYLVNAILPSPRRQSEAGAASRRSAPGQDERRGQGIHPL